MDAEEEGEEGVEKVGLPEVGVGGRLCLLPVMQVGHAEFSHAHHYVDTNYNTSKLSCKKNHTECSCKPGYWCSTIYFGVSSYFIWKWMFQQ